MSAETNKALVQAMIEGPFTSMLKGTDDHIRDYLTSDVVFHTPLLTTSADHTDGVHAEIRAYAEAIRDFDLTIDFILADGDLVALHTTAGGTHHQSFQHPAGDIAPSGQDVEGGTMIVVRLRDERISEIWYYSNLPEAIRAGSPA